MNFTFGCRRVHLSWPEMSHLFHLLSGSRVHHCFCTGLAATAYHKTITATAQSSITDTAFSGVISYHMTLISTFAAASDTYIGATSRCVTVFSTFEASIAGPGNVTLHSTPEGSTEAFCHQAHS